ncbi:hypothetical protein Hanom_Chr13g01199061 [Helianthus anomalus]
MISQVFKSFTADKIYKPTNQYKDFHNKLAIISIDLNCCDLFPLQTVLPFFGRSH